MRKQCLPYYFSVEGETEELYLRHVQTLINAEQSSIYSVKFDIKTKQGPSKVAKNKNIITRTQIYHVFDYEGHTYEDEIKFKNILKAMRDVKSAGKKIIYKSAYNNLTLEMWVVLHKRDCPSMPERKDYLRLINSVYDKQYTNLVEFKRIENFLDILSQISLQDIKNAINRAEAIRQHNEAHYQAKEYCGFTYYDENPATDFDIPIKIILQDCGLI